MYESGYGGDKADIYGGGYNAQEEELRRRREQQQQQMQQQSPYQQQDSKPQQPAQQPMQQAQPQQQTQQAQALQQQKTFAQMQQAGEARPAPPPPAPAQQPQQPQQQMSQQFQQLQQLQQQPMQQYYGQQVGAGSAPVGLDPVAMAANPDGYQQWLAQAQAQETSMPGSTMLATRMDPRFAYDLEQQAMPSMASSATPPQPGAFTGDLGAYMAGQLNANMPTPTLPTALSGLSAPAYTEDQQVRNAIAAMNAQMANSGGYDSLEFNPGVSSAGVNPAAAMGGSNGGGGGAGGGEAAAGVNTGGGGGSTTVTSTSTSQGPVGGADVRSALSQALANPSAFDNEQVMNLYNRLGQNIDDQFSQDDTRLREEMAARGLSDSSIMGGRLSDLNVGRRQARTELANQLGIQRAQDFAQARNAAIGLGLQQAGQDNQMTMSRESNALQNSLQSRSLGLQANNQAFNQRMGGLQFQNQLGQQKFANNVDTARLNAMLQGQGFDQGMGLANFNMNTNQQGYNQRMGWLNALTGYGQQAFNNDMAQAQFNANQQANSDNFFLQMMGLR